MLGVRGVRDGGIDRSEEIEQGYTAPRKWDI